MNMTLKRFTAIQDSDEVFKKLLQNNVFVHTITSATKSVSCFREETMESSKKLQIRLAIRCQKISRIYMDGLVSAEDIFNESARDLFTQKSFTDSKVFRQLLGDDFEDTSDANNKNVERMEQVFNAEIDFLTHHLELFFLGEPDNEIMMNPTLIYESSKVAITVVFELVSRYIMLKGKEGPKVDALLK
jgi:hypothetical protein